MFLSKFEDNSRRKMLRLLTYHPQWFDNTVLSQSTKRKHIANIVHHYPPPTFATLGDLNALPVELLNEILQYSDLYTISMFSLLNRQARTIVHASFPYKHLLRHAPRGLVALTRTVGSQFTVDEVFHAFCSPVCCICHNFGAFLWIPECVRCCFLCLKEAPELMPMTKNRAKSLFGLSKKALAKVPIMITLPGTYSPFNNYCRRPRHLLSRARAHQVAIMTHGGAQELATYMGSKMSHAAAIREAASGTVDNVARFMSAIPFPYFDPASRTTHIGRACWGCERASHLPKNMSAELCEALVDKRDQTYTEMGFFEHLEDCLESQRLWIRYQRTGKFRSHKSSSDHFYFVAMKSRFRRRQTLY